MTATPERANRENLADIWDRIVYRLQLAEAVRQGYLCDLRAVRVQVAVDLDRVRTHDGDFSEVDLERALADAGAPDHAVRAYRDHAPGRKAIVFTPGIQLAHEMAEAFDAAGIPAAAIDESTPREERASVLRAFRRGEVRVMANCGILTEGYDEPSTDAIIIARPTKSRPLYVQMVGRGTRRHPGKTDCQVIDLVGDSERHDLVTVGDLFDLDLPEGASVVGEFERLEAGPREEGEEVPVEGELVAHRVELFDSRRFQWACGDGLYVLPAGDAGQVALSESEDGWRVWHLGHDFERVLAEGLDVEYAQGTAEDLVRHLGGLSLARRGAAWREEAASEGQLAALRRMGLPAPQAMTRGKASEQLSLEIARRALQPATARQLRALRGRGEPIPAGLTKREASRLLGGGKVA